MQGRERSALCLFQLGRNVDALRAVLLALPAAHTLGGEPRLPAEADDLLQALFADPQGFIRGLTGA